MADQKLTSAPKIRIDARKFLADINKGFGSQIKLVEAKLRSMAEQLDTRLRLVSHNYNRIMFEDEGSHVYYVADLTKSNRSYIIENIKCIEVVDQEKAVVFDQACLSLVRAIEEGLDHNDVTEAEKIFNRIRIGYCTPKVIPTNGVVQTRDGMRHYVPTIKGVIPEEVYPEVVRCLKEAIAESRVILKENTLIHGEKSIEVPIDELTRRRVVARRMKNVAENAYQSNNFKRLIKTVASSISKQELKEAIKLCSDFLKEQQEFCMLDKSGLMSLVENSLYSQGVWNYKVVQSTASTIWETNCHVNKKDILEQWQIASNNAKVQEFTENVDILHDSSKKSPKEFSDTYDRFLVKFLTEDASSKTVKAQAYLNMLKMLHNIVSGSDADTAVKGSVDDLMMRLEGDINNIDDALLFEVEDLLANVSTDLIHDTATLGNFDTIPEPHGVDTFGTDMDQEGEFAGDMGELGGGLSGVEGELGGEAETEAAEEEVGEEGEEEGEEEEEEEALQLAHVIQNAKPIAEMEAADIEQVIAALAQLKENAVVQEGKKIGTDLGDKETLFVKRVMDRSKQLDENLFEQMASAYYDLRIAEKEDKNLNKSDDPYVFSGIDAEINEEFQGIKEEDECEEERREIEDDDEEELEEGMSDKVKRRRRGHGYSVNEEESKAEEVVEEQATEVNIKDNEDKSDKDGDYDDNETVDESMAIVTDSDEELLAAIEKILAKKGEVEKGGEEDDEEGGELIKGEEEGELDPDIDPDQDGTPIWKDKDDQEMEEGKEKSGKSVQEDNNITDPQKKEYSSEKAAKESGDGTARNKEVQFSDEDYDGTGKNKTGKDKPDAGLSSATKD